VKKFRLSIRDITKFINAISLIGISIIVGVAFIFQFVFNELPCPLCLIQRIGLLGIGFGFLLNIHFEIRPAHYAYSLLAAVFTSFASLRQILLHIQPGDPGFGSALFGLHMYTWTFVLCIVFIIYLSIMLSIPIQYQLKKDASQAKEARNKRVRLISHAAFAIYVVIIGANVISTFLECGIYECPDDPTYYILLGK
jgi:disulfide bond formation protein DsbB